MEKEVIILWGLPGAGKTTFARDYAMESKGWFVLDLDGMIENGKLDLDLVERRINNSSSNVIVDGLITTNAAALTIINRIKTSLIKIYWWEKDIDTCLHNDLFRRELSSTITIKNIPFEEPNADVLKVNEIVKMKSKRKDKYQVWADKFKIPYDELRSDSWSLGGTWGDYMGNTGQLSPDPQKTEFAELDDLLLQINPNMGILQYKKIYRECVKIDTNENRDYYGGQSSYAYYCCDVKKLFEILEAMGFLG